MAENKVDLILHPVRMRILTTLSGRQMTTQQIAAALSDVAQATLYRHINKLVQGGVLVVVEERPVRGTVEKVYAFASADVLNLTEDDVRHATHEDHVRYFTTWLATLMADYTRYLNDRPDADPAQDGVGYHTVPLYLSDAELDAMGEQLQRIMLAHLEPQSGRQRRLFSFVFMPSADEEE